MRLFLAALAAALLMSAGLPAASHAGLSLPEGYEELVVAEGLEYPSDLAYAPDGRMFVSELAGTVKVVNPGEEPVARRLLDISDHVNSEVDRGLLGIAVDSDFESNGFLYLLYTHDGDKSKPRAPKVARLTRVTIRDDNTVENPSNPETVILGTLGAPCPPPANDVDCIPSNEEVHTVGDVEAGPDGTLFVSSGDGMWSRGPRPGVFQTYDTESLAGKILHVDRAGRGLPGHPFCAEDTNLDHVCTKVHAVGVRNAYRLTLDPAGRLFAGDVGWVGQEEIDLVPAGANLGWPCWEGTVRPPGFDDHPFCIDFYRRVGAVAPIHSYSSKLGDTGASVTLGPLLGGAAYPEADRDWLYYGDYVQGLISRLKLTPGGEVSSVEPFARGFDGTILEESPAGELVWGSLFEGTIRRVVHAPANRTPVVRASATPRWGDPPLVVSFRGSDSVDPEGDRLTYRWTFGDGGESTEADPVHVYREAGPKTARLTVSDGEKSATHAVTVWPGNRPPEVSLIAPESYAGGDRLRIEAEGTDPEDGTLSASALHWRVVLHHGDHMHPLRTDRGAATHVDIGRDHDADSHVEVTLTATDSAGLEVTRTAVIRPRTAALTLDSDPPGAALTYGAARLVSPFSGVAAVGFTPVVTAGERFVHDGREYTFDSWSNGGERIQQLPVPATGLRLTAFYRAEERAEEPGAGPPPGRDPGADPPTGTPPAEPAPAGPLQLPRRAPSAVGSRVVPVRGARGSVVLRCAKGGARCRGRLLVEQRGSRGWRSLARAGYVVPAGSHRRAAFRLSATARRALARRGRLAVRVRTAEYARAPGYARSLTLRAVR